MDLLLKNARCLAVMLALVVSGALLTGCVSAHDDSEVTEADYVIENVSLVPMNVETVLDQSFLAVKDGVIIAIGSQDLSSRVVAPTRIDGTGQFLIPGLADMHIHLRMNPQAMFNLLLANGVTTAMNMRLADGNGSFDHLQLRSEVAAGRMAGPRYLVSGPQLGRALLPDLKAVEAVLDDHVEQGFDVVKIHEDIPTEIFDAVIVGAQERNLRVTGHLQHHLPLSRSLKMKSVEHVEEFLYTSRDGFGDTAGDFEAFLPLYHAHVDNLDDAEYRRRIVQEVAGSGAYVDPTLLIYKMVSKWADESQYERLGSDKALAYLPASTSETYLDPGANPYLQDFPLPLEHLQANQSKLRRLVAEFNEAGVPLLLGTDSLGTMVPGFAVHDELELLVEAGLTPFEALQAGTTNVAAYLDEADRAGTIEVGKRADLVLLAGNPLDSIANTRKITGVLTSGRWYSAAALSNLLEQARRLNNPQE